MTSILLGGLALAGILSSNTKTTKKASKKKLDESYSTNMIGKVQAIEKTQAKNLVDSIQQNKPEYFKQFDELTLDSIGEPVALTDAHTTTNGVNSSLQRNLDLNNGYSNVFDSLDYGVVNKEHFTHHNMTPNTSRRDYTLNSSQSSRKLEAFTGQSEFYVPKQVKYNLFEPMKDLTYVNGMPVMTDYLETTYIPSNKNNNGNLPFQNNVLVRPGLDGEIRQGLGTVYRVNPRNVDELRSEQNQKITYLNKPLETIKKGEIRAQDFNLTHYKMPDFREQTFDKLIPVRAMNEGPIQTGKFTDIITQRGASDINYTGPATNSGMGDVQSNNMTKHEVAKKQNFKNDPTHAVNAVNVKPVLQNKGSWSNVETQRATVNSSQAGQAYNNNGASYMIDPKDVPLVTTRQLMIDGVTNIGVAGSQQQANYIFSNDMVLPVTNRQIISHNNILGGRGENNNVNTLPTDKAKTTINETTLSNKTGYAAPTYGAPNTMLTDKAKTTINETTLSHKSGYAAPTYGAPNTMLTDKAKTTINETTLTHKTGYAAPTYGAPNTMLTDKAKTTINETTLAHKTGYAAPTYGAPNTMLTDTTKPTIKQTTLFVTPGMNVAFDVVSGYTKDDKDIAKTTIRQTTENTQYEGPAYGTDNYAGYTLDEKDIAKNTIRQTTENTQYEGPAYGTDNYAGYTLDEKDIAKPTIKQTTLLTNYTGGLSTDVEKQISHLSTDNMTIDEKRQIGTYNRPANGGKNYAGPQINKKSVKMNQRKPSIYYVGPAGQPRDNNSMPSVTTPYKNNTFVDMKPQLTYGDYYTNNVYINTLKDNPLVNDIYHQKNV